MRTIVGSFGGQRAIARAVSLFLLGACILTGCTVRNPSYRPEEWKDLSVQGPDHRATARTDYPGYPVAEPDAGPDLAYDTGASADAATEAGREDAPSDLGQPDGPLCLPDEVPRGDRCYALLAPRLPVAQKVAAQLCLDRGASLVAINTAAENAFLLGLLPPGAQGVWIGLVRTGPGKKDFAWLSGEPLAFTSWAPSEPNNAGGLEDCVVLWGPGLADPKLRGNWNDAPCSFPRDLLLCERALTP